MHFNVTFDLGPNIGKPRSKCYFDIQAGAKYRKTEIKMLFAIVGPKNKSQNAFWHLSLDEITQILGKMLF